MTSKLWGGEIKTTLTTPVNQEEVNPTVYFYSVVQAEQEKEGLENVKCVQALPSENAQKKFACSLFDLVESKNSSSPITDLQQKINVAPLTLSAVVKAAFKKHYLLRTEEKINDNVTKIGVKNANTDSTIVTIALQQSWEKNIPQYKTE